MGVVAAIDLGATSGRVILGRVEHGELRLQPVARFPNTPVQVSDGRHWDILFLYSAAMAALGRASREEPALVGTAVDAWAVDYGLLIGGRLLGNPYHYRDPRTAAGVAAVHAPVSPEDLWTRNGLQHLPFNTVFQLAADAAHGLLAVADRLLLVPDLVGFWATDTMAAERTNASTTGLLPVRGDDWDHDLIARLDLPPGLLPSIVDPGQELGAVTASVRAEFGIAHELTVTTVGSHDTASSVVGVPSAGEGTAYISCGTWSLVGTELPSPVTTDAARAAGFTNERGVDGRIRFLTNVMGLWLLSESIRTWATQGRDHNLERLLAQAADTLADVPTFDPDDPRLLAPGDMPTRIADLLREKGVAVPGTAAEFVRCITQSLADAYARAVRDIERLTGQVIATVHLVGGGAQNTLLCQLTADAVGGQLVAGPVEATAIGNLLVQARTHGLLHGDVDALRSVVAHSFPPRTYTARTRSSTGG